MNEVEIVEWWHYKIRENYMEYTEDLYLIKLVKIETGFFTKKIVDWIVFSSFENWDLEAVMKLSDFKKCVLYKV